ncbi:MAG: hypothetical protein V3U29_03870, partial [Phycisphaeraceae bacterium]
MLPTRRIYVTQRLIGLHDPPQFLSVVTRSIENITQSVTPNGGCQGGQIHVTAPACETFHSDQRESAGGHYGRYNVELYLVD